MKSAIKVSAGWLLAGIMLLVTIAVTSGCETVEATLEEARIDCSTPAFVDISAPPYYAEPWTDETLKVKEAIADIAVCGGGTLWVPDFYFLSPQEGQYLGSITTTDGLTIDGPGRGSAGFIWAPGEYGGGDKYMVFVYDSTGVVIQNITLDGNWAAITSLDEQTHAMVIRQSDVVVIDNVEFRNAWSDGIKMFDSNMVQVTNSYFHDNHRVNLSIHSNLDLSQFVNNFFAGEGPHLEPGNNTDFNLFADNTIHLPDGGYGLVVSGSKHSTFDRNTIDGGGIQMVYVEDIHFTNNMIVQRNGPYGVMGVSRYANRMMFDGNTFENDVPGDTGENWTLGFSYANELYPSGVSFSNNVIYSKGCGSSVYFHSTVNVMVHNNQFYGHGSDLEDCPTNIQNYGTVAVSGGPVASELPYDGLYMTDNLFRGYTYAISIGASHQDVTNVVAEDNAFSDIVVKYRTETNNGHTIDADFEY